MGSEGFGDGGHFGSSKVSRLHVVSAAQSIYYFRSIPIYSGLSKLFRFFELSCFILPYIIIAMIYLGVRTEIPGVGPVATPISPSGGFDITLDEITSGIFNSAGQIYLSVGMVPVILIHCAIFIASPFLLVHVVIGEAAGTLLSVLLYGYWQQTASDPDGFRMDVSNGVLGFNAALTAAAIGFFYVPSLRLHFHSFLGG